MNQPSKIPGAPTPNTAKPGQSSGTNAPDKNQNAKPVDSKDEAEDESNAKPEAGNDSKSKESSVSKS